jgi:hypothetical protein
MDDIKIWKILEDLVKNHDFPGDDMVEERHLDKFYNIEKVGKNKVRFCLDRHPHILHRPSLGKKSSAYTPTKYLYELDLQNKKVILVTKEEEDPIIDFFSLASEDVEAEFLEGDISEYQEAFKKMDSADKVKEYALKVFPKAGYDAWADINSEISDIPGFKKKYLSEAKGLFVARMIESWRDFKKDWDPDDEEN